MVAKERLEQQHDRDITLAYNIASLTRGTKGLPPLEKLLASKRARASRRQTVKEQIAMWQVIAARFGGQFTPVTPEAPPRG